MKNHQNNLEFQRRQLWSNTVTASIRSGYTVDISVKCADQALSSFDSRFKPKPKDETRTKTPVLLNESKTES